MMMPVDSTLQVPRPHRTTKMIRWVAVSVLALCAASMLQSPAGNDTTADRRYLANDQDPKPAGSLRVLQEGAGEGMEELKTWDVQDVDQQVRRMRNLRADLRYASFGGSSAWGVELDERFDAYPYQLSDSVTNYGFFSTRSNYASTCLETMVGDDHMFDVITLDFTTFDQGAIDLAKRLRERFPQALIIFVEYWRPKQMNLVDPVSRQGLRWENWMKNAEMDPEEQRETGMDRQVFKNKIAAEKVLHSHLVWEYADNTRAVLLQTIEDVGGELVHLPIDETDMGETLLNGFKYFNDNGVSLSVEGHWALAYEIQQIVSAAAIDPNLATHGEWANGGDACNVWFTTGGTNIVHSDTIEMKEYDERCGKYALEIYDEGWLEINQPFADNRTLWLSYIVTEGETKEYPGVRVTSNNSTDFTPTGDIDVRLGTTVQAAGLNGVHAPRTISVGKLPQGTHTIMIQTIDKDLPLPFRLVGASFGDGILDEDGNKEIHSPHEWDFTAKFNE